jgi:hypothetical protein
MLQQILTHKVVAETAEYRQMKVDRTGLITLVIKHIDLIRT